MVKILSIITKSHWVSPGGKGRHPGSKRVLPRVENPNSPFLSFASVRAFSPALPYFTFLFVRMHHHSYLCLHLSLGTRSLLLFKVIGERVQNYIFLPPPTSSTPYASYFLSLVHLKFPSWPPSWVPPLQCSPSPPTPSHFCFQSPLPHPDIHS